MKKYVTVDVTHINLVINTLNNVETKGKENLDRLLGCIVTLERIAAQAAEGDTNGKQTDK